MAHIVPDIISLMQYLSLLDNNQEAFRPEKCPHCGKTHLWRHGVYFRQSDRINPSTASLNAIPIQRYYCSGCKQTCSVLPECIPPHRWYLWETQGLILLAIFMGGSIYATAKEALPSRQTMGRWIKRFKEQFVFHKDTLCTFFSDLGRAGTNLKDFWLAAFKKIRLAQAMRLCHLTGVFIP